MNSSRISLEGERMISAAGASVAQTDKYMGVWPNHIRTDMENGRRRRFPDELHWKDDLIQRDGNIFIADLGCGNGYESLHLLAEISQLRTPKETRYVFVENAKAGLDSLKLAIDGFAPHLNDTSKILLGDLMKLSLKDLGNCKLDGAYLKNVIHWLRDPKIFLANLYDIFNINATVYIETISPLNPMVMSSRLPNEIDTLTPSETGILWRKFKSMEEFTPDYDYHLFHRLDARGMPTSFHAFTISGLKQLARNTGFEVEKISFVQNPDYRNSIERFGPYPRAYHPNDRQMKNRLYGENITAILRKK